MSRMRGLSSYRSRGGRWFRRVSTTPAAAHGSFSLPGLARWVMAHPRRCHRLSLMSISTLLDGSSTGSWHNRFRALLVRWERKARNYLALLHLACAVVLQQSS